MAITDSENNIVACVELPHRGAAIKKGLSTRAGYRRSKRTRKLRHRQSRWANRSRKAPVLTAEGWRYPSFGQSSEDWSAPSLRSRVFNIHTWTCRLCRIYPITRLAVEHVKFDTQLLENPENTGCSVLSVCDSVAESEKTTCPVFSNLLYYLDQFRVALQSLPQGMSATLPPLRGDKSNWNSEHPMKTVLALSILFSEVDARPSL